MPTSGESSSWGRRSAGRIARQTESQIVLLDTSAAIAFCQPSHAGHAATLNRLRGARMGLSGHATFETYSVLTRMPPPQRVSGDSARQLISVNFPHPVFLSADVAVSLTEEFARVKITGGATYDGLVGAAAREHDLLLITRDHRAAETYRALGVKFEMLS